MESEATLHIHRIPITKAVDVEGEGDFNVSNAMAALFPLPKPKQEHPKNNSLPFRRVFNAASLRAGQTTPLEAVCSAAVLTSSEDEERDGRHPNFLLLCAYV